MTFRTTQAWCRRFNRLVHELTISIISNGFDHNSFLTKRAAKFVTLGIITIGSYGLDLSGLIKRA